MSLAHIVIAIGGFWAGLLLVTTARIVAVMLTPTQAERFKRALDQAAREQEMRADQTPTDDVSDVVVDMLTGLEDYLAKRAREAA